MSIKFYNPYKSDFLKLHRLNKKFTNSSPELKVDEYKKFLSFTANLLKDEKFENFFICIGSNRTMLRYSNYENKGKVLFVIAFMELDLERCKDEWWVDFEFEFEGEKFDDIDLITKDILKDLIKGTMSSN